MGVICDFIIADAAEAAEINASHGTHPPRWPVLESKGVDPFKLGTLWAIVSGTEEDALYMAGPEWEIDTSEDSGSAVFRVPPDLVAAVAGLETETAKSVAIRWAEVFRHDGCSTEDVVQYFERFRRFARESRTLDKDLLLWLCT